MNTAPPSRSADQFVVRLPEGMRDNLKVRATANNRSMNAEIVAILGAAMGDQSSLGSASVEVLLKEVAARLGATVQIHVIPVAAAVTAKAGTKRAK